MATRGIAVLIDNEHIHFGPSFNGDMFGEEFGGLGDEFMRKILDVENVVDFIKANNSFNKHNHGYDKIMSRYKGKFDLNDFLIEGQLVIPKIVDKTDYNDFVFIKNITDQDFICKFTGETDEGGFELDEFVCIHPGQVARFYFSDYEDSLSKED